MRLYVAGPMTGIEDSNYPAFNRAATELRAAGYLVENPAEDAPDGLTWSGYMRLALVKLLRCDGVALLPRWYTSRGALLEQHLARRLGMDVQDVATWLDPVFMTDDPVESCCDFHRRLESARRAK